MGLESATHIDELNSSNPAGTDQRSTADDHIRLVKAVLQTDFPNISGVVSASDGDLSACENFEETISATTSEVSIATGKTLNVVDNEGLKINGTAITATAAELNALDGITATVTELNVLDNVDTTNVDGVSINNWCEAIQDKAISFTAAAGGIYRVDTSAATRVVTLPSAPADGTVIRVMDHSGDWATNACSIRRGGTDTVEGATADFDIDVAGYLATIVYNATTNDWRIH